MNVAVDFGNSSAKVGIFQDDILNETLFFNESAALQDWLSNSAIDNIIVSSVSVSAEEVLGWSVAPGKKISLTPDLPLPVAILYKTPLTLGVVRIAAVCGAFGMFPRQRCLVVDAGTCITFEFLDADGNYHGGSISPGVKMRFDAMHHFTARLPLIEAVSDSPLIGTSTETSMQSGVINGIRAEVNGIIHTYRMAWPGLHVILCGGDAHFFHQPDDPGRLIVPDLVLNGLNEILMFIKRPS